MIVHRLPAGDYVDVVVHYGDERVLLNKENELLHARLHDKGTEVAVPVHVAAVLHAVRHGGIRSLEAACQAWRLNKYVPVTPGSVLLALKLLEDTARAQALRELGAAAGPLDVISAVFLIESEG